MGIATKRRSKSTSSPITSRPRGRPPKAVKYITRVVPMDYVRKVEKLNLEGANLAENWRIFWQNFQIFCTAAELDKKADEVKVAVFLNAIGPEAVEVFNSFGLSEEEKKKYQSVTSAFANFCKPRKNEIYESFLFNNRKQEPGDHLTHFCWT